MKSFLYVIMAAWVLLVPGRAAAYTDRHVHVVASCLDMADFVHQIGGERVHVTAILNGNHDPHHYDARPSEVMDLKRADMVVAMGMELDAFLPGMIDASRNPKIRFGKPGFVDPSVGVHAHDVPEGKISGKLGDVHPYGNPHFWYTPENVMIACRNIRDGLIRVDPENAEHYRAGYMTYIRKVNQTFEELKTRLEPYKDRRILEYHPSWGYFFEYFPPQLVGEIEPKPGIPPSTRHLRNLVKDLRENPVDLVIAEPFYPDRPFRFLERELGLQTRKLPLFLGGEPGVETYLENITYIVDQLIEAFEENS